MAKTGDWPRSTVFGKGARDAEAPTEAAHGVSIDVTKLEEAMQTKLCGKKVLIFKGSLLAHKSLEAAFVDQEARVVTTTNIISALTLLEGERFDGVVIDKGLHNEAADLCAELRSRNIPYVTTDTPRALQKPAAQRQAANIIAFALSERIASNQWDQAGFDFPAIAQYPAVRGMASMAVAGPPTLKIT